MTDVPINRRFLRAAEARVHGNIGDVRDALRMRVPEQGARVEPAPHRGMLVLTEPGIGAAYQVGRFSGALGGICAGIVVGMAASTALSPFVALGIIIILAIGGATLGGMILAEIGALGGLIGVALGLVGGAWLGMFLGVYVVFACPAVGAIFGAYHGSVQGMRLGGRTAMRFGAMHSGILMNLLAGVSVGIAWLTFVCFTHRVAPTEAVTFLAMIVFVFVGVGGTICYAAFAYLTAGQEAEEEVNRAKTYLPFAATSALICFVFLQNKAMWTQISIPSSWLRNWVLSPSHSTASMTTPVAVRSDPSLRYLKNDTNLRGGPGTNWKSMMVLPQWSEVHITSVSPDHQWVGVKAFNGFEGFVTSKVLDDVPVSNLPTPRASSPVIVTRIDSHVNEHGNTSSIPIREVPPPKRRALATKDTSVKQVIVSHVTKRGQPSKPRTGHVEPEKPLRPRRPVTAVDSAEGDHPLRRRHAVTQDDPAPKSTASSDDDRPLRRHGGGLR